MARLGDEEILRYARQIVLPEWGGIGQERVRAASAEAESESEALYLAGAGVGTLAVPSEAIAESVRALNPLVQVSVRAEMALAPDSDGARRALRTLKRVLEL
jgi:adenylyltransferase/sulfurtransferase